MRRGGYEKERQEHSRDHAAPASVTETFPEKQSLPPRRFIRRSCGRPGLRCPRTQHPEKAPSNTPPTIIRAPPCSGRSQGPEGESPPTLLRGRSDAHGSPKGRTPQLAAGGGVRNPGDPFPSSANPATPCWRMSLGIPGTPKQSEPCNSQLALKEEVKTARGSPKGRTPQFPLGLGSRASGAE